MQRACTYCPERMACARLTSCSLDFFCRAGGVKSTAGSRSRPASRRIVRSPRSVSSLAAHPPAAPEPTTIASYVSRVVTALRLSCHVAPHLACRPGGEEREHQGRRTKKPAEVAKPALHPAVPDEQHHRNE